jgi:hypothetical protein
MGGLDKNRLAVLVTVILMMLIAAISGYRLELGATGLTFERGTLAR